MESPQVTEKLLRGFDGCIDNNEEEILLNEYGIEYTPENIEEKLNNLYEEYQYLDGELRGVDLGAERTYHRLYFKYHNHYYSIGYYYTNGKYEYIIDEAVQEVEPYQEIVIKYRPIYE